MVTVKERREGDSAWLLVLGVVIAAILGWLLLEGKFLLRLDEAIGFETTAPREVAWAVLTIVFGVLLGFAFPRWWYLMPIAAVSLDTALALARGESGSLWPIAVGIRVFWMLLILGGAFMGRLVRRRYRSRGVAIS